MSSPLRTFRSFAVEMMKLAADVQDGEIRKLLAERKGSEYLSGGKLPSNSIEDEMSDQKTASMTYSNMAGPAGNYDLSSKKKKSNSYQHGRDYAASGVKGGLTGLGILGAANAMKGHFGAPVGAHAIRNASRSAQRAFTAGAGLAIADRAYRHNDIPGMDKKATFVNPGATDLKSPAESLATGQRTGGFKSVIHNTGKPPQSLQLGKKFRLP